MDIDALFWPAIFLFSLPRGLYLCPYVPQTGLTIIQLPQTALCPIIALKQVKEVVQ
jgi:hypothetical protein